MTPIDIHPRSKKPTTIIGAIAFIVLVTIVVLNAGFINSYSHHTDRFEPFLTNTGIWILTVALGLFGGIMLDPKHFIIMGFTGMLSAIAMTGFTLMYISWRSSLLSIEFIVPLLFCFLVGRGIYLFLAKFFLKKKDDIISI